MFQIGELIIYGNAGVCRVDAIGSPALDALSAERTYYTLTPLYQDGTIYTPVDTTIFMRPIINYEQARQLINRIPHMRENICIERNLRMLNDHYKESLQRHSCEDLLQMIKDIYAKGKMVAEQGKKLGSTDEKYMKQAEDLLHGELAVALDIGKDEVAEYIKQSVQEAAADMPQEMAK